jgi:hypothetical protein
MTTARYFAFGTIRTSGTVYTWASKDRHGRVRFHTSETAARRISGLHCRTRIATPEDRREVREAKAAAEAARAARAEAFMREWSA